MNKYKHQMLWLMLPAVLVVFYFAIFQPGPDSTSDSNTAINNVDTGPVQIVEPAETVEATTEPAEVVSTDDSRPQVPANTDQNSEEVARDREYINYAFPLLSTWDLQEIKPLLADATIAASSDEELSEVMSVLEDRLGHLKYFETPEPVATLNTEQDPAEAGDLQLYQFVAYYETGEAEINLILHKERNDNSLYSFNINVPN